MKGPLLIVILLFGACDTAEAPARDTSVADTVSEVADTTVVTDVTPDTAEDAVADSVDLDADVSPFDVTETVEDTSLPLNRNCEFDPRLGNQWPADARCKACRSIVGTQTTKVIANLVWWGSYTTPQSNPRLCAQYPDEDCSGEIAEAEVVYCENIDSGKKRVVWMDVGVVTLTQDDVESKASMRGPLNDLLLAELRLDEDHPLTVADAFTPGTWIIATPDKPPSVVVEAGRPDQQCPVGKFSIANTRKGTIADCQNALGVYIH